MVTFFFFFFFLKTGLVALVGSWKHDAYVAFNFIVVNDCLILPLFPVTWLPCVAPCFTAC